MRYFRQTDFTDRNGRIWFHADKYAPISGDLTGSLEQLTFSGTAITDLVGDVVCDFQNPEANWVGHEGGIGQIDGSLQQLTLDVTATYEPPSTGNISCTMQPPFCVMAGGRGIAAQLERFEFAAYSTYRSKDMDVVFKELDMFATGENSFRYLEAEMSPMTLSMDTGAKLSLSVRKPTMEMTGVAGVIGNIDARMQRPSVSMTGGPPPYFDCKLEAPELSISGTTDIHADMSCKARLMSISISGVTDIVGSIDVRMRPMQLTMQPDYTYSSGVMSASMGTPRLSMTAIPGVDGDVEIMLREIRCSMTAFYDGLNNLNLTIKPADINMGSDVGWTGSCDAADTVTFDEDLL